MYTVEVFVTYKESILDPQGQAIMQGVHQMGYEAVKNIRQGKYFQIEIAKEVGDVDQAVADICDRLLANVNMETYRYTIKEV
ncbi:phosphoribosylformylglycinamidine synthase subunit PurS [Aerococcus urinae]